MKKVLVLLISIFTLALNVSADSDHGICAGKEVTGEGYCTLESGVSISGVAFNPSVNNLTNGHPAAQYNYRGGINGKTEHLYCIDSNLTSPSGSSYSYARALDPDRFTLDGMLARMYVSLVNSAVYDFNNGACSNLDDCFNKYLQAANVLMRALVTKQGYNIQPKDSWGCVTLGTGAYQNVVRQLEGKSYTGTALKEDGQYNIIKNWYQTASSASGYSGQSFKIEAELNRDEEIVTEENGDTFTKIIPIDLTGLENFKYNYETWKKTNPKVQITELECSEGLTCEIDTEKSGFNLKDNLVEKFNEDKITFYVKVTGNSKMLKDKKKGTLTVKIDKYHVLDTDNLAILRGYATQAQGLSEYLPGKSMHSICYQRMVALMPTTPQKVELEIDLELPPYCKAETDDQGNKTYKLGTEEVSISDYINEGCCTDVDTSQLSEAELEVFEANCGGEDIVDLKQECGAGSCEGNNGTLPAKNVDSYVKQVSMKGTMDKVYKWENSASVNTATYAQQTKENLKYWRDDEFASELESNPYCKIYTSEENHMYYPTTTTATSGRFFVFGKGEDGQYLQPYVDGKIYSTFHTAFELWQKDYIKAIKTEKSAYTAWQYAENIKDALSHETTESHSHQYVCGSHTDSKGNSVPDYCTCNYTTHKIKAEDTYYNGDYPGTTQAKYTNQWDTGHSCGSGNGQAPTYNAGAGAAYQAAKAARKELERQKTECQDASKKYVESWKYILEPDLTFHYNQKYYDSVSGQSKFLTTDIDMVISDQAEKYFPNVSTRVTNPTATSGGWNGVDFNQADGAEYEGALYGGSNHLGPRVEEPYENVDKTDNEHHNYTRDFEDIKLYYRPDKAYYSLIPTGLYITNVDITSAQDALDIGYVFNVQITNYQGEYETWFTIKNNGHLEIEPTNDKKNESNIQYRINQYLEEHASEFTDSSNGIDASKAFSSKCIYCNREVIYERDCITCEDDENFKPNYIYRTVNPSDIDPNNRGDSGDLGNNWSNPKGEAAENRINSLGKADSIYDDHTKENLEYEFNLSTKVMQEIKKSNKSTNYYDFGLKCNDYGKECESTFINEYASYTEGRNKYKYYVNGTFKVGTMDSLLGGTYPELEDCPDKLCP